VSVDFNAALLLVIENAGEGIALTRVVCGGQVEKNKGVNTDRNISLPPITEKDRQAIAFARRQGITTFALSFASGEAAVLELRAMVGDEATIIAKVETQTGVANLDAIIRASDAILIDRGDLSREVPVERLPALQKLIIAKCHQKPIPVYVATNLLESMVLHPRPSRAEINDVANTLLDGANGLVLAAETAIGKYPVQCVSMVRRLIQQHQDQMEYGARFEGQWVGNGLLSAKMLPYGKSANGHVAAIPKKGHENKGLPNLGIDLATVRDLENITSGCYAPLSGFMGEEEIESVLNHYTLLDGSVWTMPIVLQCQMRQISATLGDTVALVAQYSDKLIGWLTISDLYKFDLDSVASRWFGTTDTNHPGVLRLSKRGDCFVGGQVTLARSQPSIFSEYCLSPSQVRAIFAHHGWDRVVGFHTRNVPHRAHEYIQKQALQRSHADALFVHPALGQKKSGDFTAAAIMEGYKALINAHYPADRVLLSGFFANSWYAGPREAVFTALCRRNYGCSHFIVGRDHTGVGDFYKPEDVRALFDQLGDLGIEPLFFDTVVYDQTEQCYREIAPSQSISELREISGAEVRRYITTGRKPPEWMMWPEVSSVLLNSSAARQQILVP
jgi:ATP sulfurylase